MKTAHELIINGTIEIAKVMEFDLTGYAPMTREQLGDDERNIYDATVLAINAARMDMIDEIEELLVLRSTGNPRVVELNSALEAINNLKKQIV